MFSYLRGFRERGGTRPSGAGAEDEDAGDDGRGVGGRSSGDAGRIVVENGEGDVGGGL